MLISAPLWAFCPETMAMPFFVCAGLSSQATKVELAATRAVVAEQASTERSLLAEAAQTTSSLGAAELDVEGLRAKVARQVCSQIIS